MNELPDGYGRSLRLKAIDASPVGRRRPPRAGLLTLGAGVAFCADVRGRFSASYVSDQTNPYGCLGGQLLASAMFEWIEAFYNPVRRHSGRDYRSPVDFEALHTTANPAA